MIYKREEYVQEDQEDKRFPIKRITVLAPVEGDQTRYIGEVALGIQTPAGVQQIPVSFEIEAPSIQEAFQKFVATAEPRIEETRKQIEEELRKMRQEASSRIVRPGELGVGGQRNVIDMGNLKKPE